MAVLLSFILASLSSTCTVHAIRHLEGLLDSLAFMDFFDCHLAIELIFSFNKIDTSCGFSILVQKNLLHLFSELQTKDSCVPENIL